MTVTRELGTRATAPPVGPEDRTALGECLRDLLGRAPGRVDDPAWVAEARRAWEDVPRAFRQLVRDFRRDPGPTGRLLLRDLPIGTDLPPTPRSDGSVQRAPTTTAAALLVVASGLGEPGSFAAEKAGALVQDVVPVPGREEMQGNAGSVELSYHTENAFHPHRPDYVLLLCLRADHEGVAELRTSCARTVVPELTERSRAALRAAEFVTERPPSFGGGGDRTPHAVLSGACDDPDLRVDQYATSALTPGGRAALAELGTLVHEHRDAVRMRPGDLAVVDNRITLHGRSSFVPRYDGGDRWLQRTFAFADFRRSRGCRALDGNVLAA